jgi:hypothetical protein
MVGKTNDQSFVLLKSQIEVSIIVLIFTIRVININIIVAAR